MTDYTSIALPKALKNEIQRIIKEYPEYGYTSVAEFCKDAIRTKISDIEK